MRRGMTLVELLVVLGLIGLLLGMGVPAVSGLAQRTRFNAATRQLRGLLGLARSMAISTQEPHALRVDPERGDVTVVNVTTGAALEKRLRLPPAITVRVERGNEPSAELEIIFQPNGSLSGRSAQLVVADTARSLVLAVGGLTGTVSQQRVAPGAGNGPPDSP